MTKDYSKMSADELDKEKYALEAERSKLRRELAQTLDAEIVSSISGKLRTIRAEMLAIQGEQDKFAVPPSPDAHHTIGVAGIVSDAVVGTIGGGGKKKK